MVVATPCAATRTADDRQRDPAGGVSSVLQVSTGWRLDREVLAQDNFTEYAPGDAVRSRECTGAVTGAVTAAPAMAVTRLHEVAARVAQIAIHLARSAVVRHVHDGHS